MGTEWLKIIARKIGTRQNNLFTYPVEKQKTYIEHFREPKDSIERGYFQYCCQMKLYGEPLHMLLNLAALPLSVISLAKCKSVCPEKEEPEDAVFLNEGHPLNIVPDSLRERYPNMPAVPSVGKCLSHEDREFLRSIFRRYPFSWMLWLKLIIKIAQYSYAITKYSPNAIIFCNEFSYTAPILIEYCHTRGVTTINVMHGEKLYYMRDTFSKYDEFYVWDQYYVDLLTDMGAEKSQFHVELPPAMRIEKQETVKIQYDYTCYLQDENEEALQTIASALKSLHDKGKRISVRPHPRYSDMKLVTKLLDFANIEDHKAVTIEQSLSQTGAAISLFSTVLNQAVNSAIPIVIDDVSNPERFAKLKELRYICLSREHKLLSQIIGEVQ
jgi:hypothetical protein